MSKQDIDRWNNAWQTAEEKDYFGLSISGFTLIGRLLQEQTALLEDIKRELQSKRFALD
jgi:hypothetical protein